MLGLCGFLFLCAQQSRVSLRAGDHFLCFSVSVFLSPIVEQSKVDTVINKWQ